MKSSSKRRGIRLGTAAILAAASDGITAATASSADFDGSVTPGLWTVNTNAVASAYVVSNLSTTHHIKIKRVATTRLAPAWWKTLPCSTGSPYGSARP